VAISVQDSLALVDLYYSTNGSNWRETRGWLSEGPPIWGNPDFDWYGMGPYQQSTKHYYRNLFSNGLDGTLPETLGDLSGVKSFLLSSNPLLTGPRGIFQSCG